MTTILTLATGREVTVEAQHDQILAALTQGNAITTQTTDGRQFTTATNNIVTIEEAAVEATATQRTFGFAQALEATA